MATQPESYRPIDCSLHDRLEAWATLGNPQRIAYHDEGGSSRVTEGRIVDVFARNGEEFIRTESGEEIRLDRLERVGGVDFCSDEAC